MTFRRRDPEADQNPNAPRKSAVAKMMDYLAKRGFTEVELRAKLADDYPSSDIDEALAKAKASSWLVPPEEMAERMAGELNRKRKGHRFINQALRQKGLPPIAEDLDAEVSKARELLETKLKHSFETDGPLPRDLEPKAQRLLFNRGFNSEAIRRALAR